MSETVSTQAALPSVAERTERDQMVALLLKPGEMAWLLEERYEAPTSSWMIAIVRQDTQARWMYQRYRYDSAVDVLFFLGERPIREDEFAIARRTGKAIRI